MSLISCPDCGRQVSDSAPTCPQCGKPIALASSQTVRTKRKGGAYEALGFVLIVAGIIACFGSATVGTILILVGFIVFLIGRFL
jgi:uncharacterized membrane protein YvbJ